MWRPGANLAPASLGLAVLAIEHGYSVDGATVITEQDILGDRLARPPRRRANFDQFIAEVSALQPRATSSSMPSTASAAMTASSRCRSAGAPHDCLRVIYAGDDKLFVPVENIEVLSRYGSEDTEVQLDRMGGVGWQSRKARVKQRIKDIAAAADRRRRRAPGEGRRADAARPKGSTRNSPRASPTPRPRTSRRRSSTASPTWRPAGRWIG